MEKEFVDLINLHRGIIFKVCSLYAREQARREDLFQDIVLQIWKSYPKFRGESLITTWMYRIALNTAISQFRKERKQPEQSPLSKSEFQIPDTSLHDHENDHAWILNQATQQLSDIEKALIMLYLEEKTYRDISGIMGISESNVGVKLSRIKAKLEKIIKQTAL